MKILGIDPGLQTTGYGFIDCDNGHIKLLEAGTISPKKEDLLQNRLNVVYKNLDEMIKQYHPDIMILEKLYTHTRQPTVASRLGHVRGVICLLCEHNNVELIEHCVKRIRKALVGNGNASKQQTKRTVAHILKVDENKLNLDASDALALALGYTYIYIRNV